MRSPTAVRRRRAARRTFVAVAVTAMVATVVPATASAQELPITEGDPRIGLAPGFADAGEASLGMDLVGSFDKADGGFFNPANVGSFDFANSDLAFITDDEGEDHVVQGNFAGFQIHDVSDPSNPTLRTEVLCPGGQGDATVYGDLLFTSVEGNNGRVDCGPQGNAGGAQEDRARGVRIWDISNIDAPQQLAVVQTCRGSHTHRLVEDPNDDSVVYIYNNGTGGQRNAGEAVSTPDGVMTGRCGQGLTSENPSTHMIEVIRVPLDDPASASVVNEARLFADVDTGAVNGLQNSPTTSNGRHPCSLVPNPITGAENSCSPASTFYSPSPNTNTCHDITAYPEIGLAAGACQGNGILIDISDPANPQRIDAVADENFSYWHSANFNNDGTSVMFTDEWGGGTGARCAPNHRLEWGANAMFSIDRSGDTPKMVFESYYKLPVAQTTQENCVAHQANIVPVPGRDILVQGWYQGGISMLDWTDPANPFEIGFFDRGPISPTSTVLGGFWSGYWFNGNVYGSEIARGLDALELTATDALSANEIAAANTVVLDEHNAMSMRKITWEPSFEVVRAYRDQAERAGLRANHVRNVDKFLERAERFQSGPQARAAVANLNAVANQVRADAPDLAGALNDLADSLG
jgi:hypothetical protein